MTADEARIAHGCPFCGRVSAEEPSLRRRPHSHLIDGAKGAYFVRCWYCSARGPLSDEPGQALYRWDYDARMEGAPRW